MLRRLLTAVTAAVALSLLAGTAQASGPAGTLGHDVSHPQCGSAYPATGSFGYVGVNGGVMFTANPCLASEAAWAAGKAYAPALYMNTANRGPESPRWPTTSSGPVPCRDATTVNDVGCAYDYGWAGATDALQQAVAQVAAFDPVTVTWFLDVEVANTWNGSAASNTAALQGMADRLRSAGVPSVGLYSKASDWSAITGGYTAANAAGYRSAWAAAFRPSYPLELGPQWISSLNDLADATSKCGTAGFTGALPLLVQYQDGAFDGDRQCAAEPTDTSAPGVAMTGPTATTSFDRATFTWLSDGSGVSSFDVRYRSAPHNAAFGALAYPVGSQVTKANQLGLALGVGRTYCTSVRARDARANLGAWSPERCTAAPLDDRSLVAGAGWTRVSATGHYRSTYTQSTTNAATLRVGVQARRLALVATTCARCGSVAVYVGGTLLASRSLYAASTRTRQVIALPTFALRTATVVIKVISPSGKVVQVDGLMASRS